MDSKERYIKNLAATIEMMIETRDKMNETIKLMDDEYSFLVENFSSEIVDSE